MDGVTVDERMVRFVVRKLARRLGSYIKYLCRLSEVCVGTWATQITKGGVTKEMEGCVDHFASRVLLTLKPYPCSFFHGGVMFLALVIMVQLLWRTNS